MCSKYPSLRYLTVRHTHTYVFVFFKRNDYCVCGLLIYFKCHTHDVSTKRLSTKITFILQLTCGKSFPRIVVSKKDAVFTEMLAINCLLFLIEKVHCWHCSVPSVYFIVAQKLLLDYAYNLCQTTKPQKPT